MLAILYNVNKQDVVVDFQATNLDVWEHSDKAPAILVGSILCQETWISKRVLVSRT